MKIVQVEIWSDVMCPFCYIGKRKFERALNEFHGKDQVEISWKSFQLSPYVVTQPEKNVHQFLAEHKGISVAEAKQMNDYVSELAAKVGLHYDFDKAIVANSRKAHQFSHFAKKYDKQNEAEELLFKAYFTEGMNTDDVEVLLELAVQLQLDTQKLRHALETGAFDKEVDRDIMEAQQIGVRGVPFFLFDRKYAVSGAQESSVFAEVLNKVLEESQSDNGKSLETKEGESCAMDGNCN